MTSWPTHAEAHPSYRASSRCDRYTSDHTTDYERWAVSVRARRRAFFSLIRHRGMTQDEAKTVALALFPMDTHRAGKPRSRQFWKDMKRRADQFAKDARSLDGSSAESIALETLTDYCHIAMHHNEQYYMGRFCTEFVNPGLTDDFR